MEHDRLNGYASYLRLITPLLVTIGIFLMTLLLSDVKELKLHFTNHLSTYNKSCIDIESRLKEIETILKYRR